MTAAPEDTLQLLLVWFLRNNEQAKLEKMKSFNCYQKKKALKHQSLVYREVLTYA